MGPTQGRWEPWMRRRENSERWTEKRLRVRTVQRENSPRPPLAPPAVKSNSLTHSGVVSVSGRVTITKDSSGAAGSVGGFWLGNLSEKTQPPFFFFLFFFLANHCLDSDCADPTRDTRRLLSNESPV